MPVGGRGEWLPPPPQPVFSEEGVASLGVRVVELEGLKIQVLLIPYEEVVGTGTFHRAQWSFVWFECNLPATLREVLAAVVTKVMQRRYPREEIGRREDGS